MPKVLLRSACDKPMPMARVDTCLALKANTIAAQSLAAAQTQTQLAGASLILGIAGTVGLLWTLRMSRLQTNAAIQGTQAARDANAFAAQQAINESRPWLLMKQFSTRRGYNTGRTEQGPPDGQIVGIEWRNGGASAALIRKRGERLILSREKTAEPDFGEVPLAEAPGAIGPDDIFYTDNHWIRGQDYADFFAGRVAAFLRCVVVYSHPKQPEHEYRSELTVRFLVVGARRHEGGFIPDIEVNQYGQNNIFT